MAEPNYRQTQLVMLFMGAFLIFGAVMATIMPADEFPPYAYAVFNIALDAVMTVLLVILLVGTLSAPSGGLKPLAFGVGVLGILAGAVQVAIRFTSDHAWWTGNYLPPVFD